MKKEILFTMLNDLLTTLKSHWPMLLGIAVISAAIFALNRDAVTERTIFEAHYWNYAQHIRGEANRNILSYPLWGYPALLALLGQTGTWLLQYVLGVGVFIWCYLALFKTDIWWKRAVILAMAAPWAAFMSVMWAGAIGVALLWIGLLCMVRGWWIAAGLAAGLALNFRSEYLLLVLALGLTVAIWRKAWAVPVLAGLLILPWWVFTGAPYSTNGGMVGVVSLGQLPGNPWGLAASDSEAYRIVDGRADPLSSEGNAILQGYVLESVLEHKGAYALKVARNLGNSFIGGFYFGDVGLWPNPLHSVWFYNVGLLALSAGLIVIALAGLARARQLDMILCGMVLVSTLALVALLQYQPRHLNVAIPAVLMLAMEWPRWRVASSEGGL